MNETVSFPRDSLGLAAERAVEAACSRFEAALRAGQAPRIEDYLGDTGEPTLSLLLSELLKLELDYRAKSGEQPTPEEYRFRFPGHVAVIAGQRFAARATSGLPRLPGYEVLAEIGRGGMGVVYKAREIELDRLVALKCLLVGDLASPDEIERFTTEARAVASLHHPSIVPIYHVGEYEGRRYFTMKFVAGGSLADQVITSPLPSRRAAEIVAEVASAVHHAHWKDIIHRDLKPANILLDEAGHPHVADFGLAKRLDGQAGVSRSGIMIGTAGYMAPEQAAGRINEQLATTDVYGLGAVLYALLTGRPPFQAATIADTLAQVTHQKPAPPQMLNPDIELDLETICLKCLEKERCQRYATARELAEDLGRFLRGEAIMARPPSWMQSGWRALRKRRDDVLDARTWSNINFAAVFITLVAHIPNFWIAQMPQPALPFCLWVGVHWVMVLTVFVKKHLVARRLPPTPDELHVVTIWWVYALSTLVLVGLSYPWDREGILTMYQPLALLTGLYHLVLGRLYWGRMYLYGLIFYGLAFVMKLKPEWAPVEFAAAYAGGNITSGILLRRYASRAGQASEWGVIEAK